MRRLVPLAVLALLTACGGHSTSRVSFHVERDGPDFAVAFPEPRELVSTPDPQDARERLARAQLPDTREHHDQLLALLDGVSSLSADHLLLLVEAVHLGEASLPEGVHISGKGTSTTTITINGQTTVFAGRGESAYAHVVDTLLERGADKLTGLDALRAGRLLGRSQSDETLVALAGRWLPEVDDGSDGALTALVEGFAGSPALSPFLVDVLAPSGRLDGDRGWALIDDLPFDDGRVSLVAALASRTERVDFAHLAQALEAMAFDSGRSEVVATLAPLLSDLEGDQLVSALRVMAFDDGRRDTLAALAPHLAELDGSDVARVLDVFAFDSGRTEALDVLTDAAPLDLDHGGLADLLRRPAFDSGRLDMLRRLEPLVEGPPDGAAARALIGVFAFDSGRGEAVRIMAEHWIDLPRQDRLALLDSFAFDSGRRDATELLMR